MITKVNKDNKADYAILFEQAADVLCGYKGVKTYDSTLFYYYKDENKDYIHLSDISDVNDFSNALDKYKVIYTPTGKPPVSGFDKTRGITTLEEYYSWIKDLGEIDRRYTVLPLDEPHFEIDANTRAIKIPAEFKKNGIAVQGDDLAEVVYFEIDRYFDYVDLSTTQIYIQWERPKDNFKSVSPAYVVDIESRPGTLIFGWAISELLTQNPGILKFSVRFFELIDGEDGKKKINYNFSTLTATIAIQPGINFNLADDSIHIDDCGDRLIGRLENGTVVGNYVAAEPKFIINLIEDDNINDINNLDIEDVSKLKVLAYSDDAGAISYSWRDNNGRILPGQYEYVAVDFENGEFDSRISYYTRSTGNYYILYTGVSKPEDNITLYKKYSVLNIETAGSYYAIAENRVTNSKAIANSKTAMYPKPNAVEIENNLLERAYLETDASMDLSVKVKDSVNSGKNKLNYSWKYSDKVSQGEPDSFGTLENTEASITISNPGYYYVDIGNTRNNVETDTERSNIIRITRPAAALKVEAEKKDFLASEILNGAPFTISIDLTNPESEESYKLEDISDSYTIDWYKDVDGNKEPDRENYLGTSIKENTFSILDKLPPHIEGYGGNYLAIVTNFFNAKKDENGQLEGVQSEIVQFSVRS